MRTLTLFALAAMGLNVGPMAGRGLAEEAADAKKGGIPDPSIARSLPGNGDIGGHRARLDERGITYGVNYIGEIWRNPRGGVTRGTVNDGRLEVVIEADLEKMMGWRGAILHANGYYIHNSARQDSPGQYGMSSLHIQNLMAISNIEALPVSRMFEAWFEQKVAGDKASIRLGQLAADSEFVVSEYAGQFVNGTFGWPLIAAANLVSGGPAYPLATPGARLKIEASERLSLLVAAFNGDPAGRGADLDDPQRRSRHGFKWQMKDRPSAIGEIQVNWNKEKEATGLPGTLKVGGWHHFGSFDDQRFGADGLSLAVSGADPARHKGNTGFYVLIDQQLVRIGEDKGLGVFARAASMPDDRNLIAFNFDAGLKAWGFAPGRPNDSLGIAMSYGRISDRARALDRDVNAASGVAAPVRSYEMALEANYIAQIVPGWSVQPVFQYVWNPGGNVPDPNDPTGTRAVKDAAVVGARTTINY